MPLKSRNRRRSKEELGFSRLYAKFLLLCLLQYYPWRCGAKVFVDFITPDFVASQMIFVDDGGVFLESANGTFQLEFQSPTQDSNFYLCIVHADSLAVIWSANRAAPVSNTDEFRLTRAGAVVQGSKGRILWSANATMAGAVVDRLQLRDDGNLVLLDAANASLWQSFDNPTDTLLPGQRLVQGSKLVSNAAENDYSPGDYVAEVTESSLELQWYPTGFDHEIYWNMKMDPRVIRSGGSTPVAYAAVDRSGLNLYSSSSSSAKVLQMPAEGPALRRAVIDSTGQLQVLSFVGGRWLPDLEAVEDPCQLPAACGPLGICQGLSSDGSYQCSCPGVFQALNNSETSEGCASPDAPSCGSNYSYLLSENSIDFVKVADAVDYFAQMYQAPISAAAVADCEDMCLKNCSCAAFFYENASAACYLEESLGTLRSNNEATGQAFLKVSRRDKTLESKSAPTASKVLPIVLGLVGAVIVSLAALGVILLCYRKMNIRLSGKRDPADSDDDDDEVLRSIPGLPTRFSYKDLQAATHNFATKIGSGGFGVVYEGTLPDGTKVAVKKLQSLGQGKKEFYSEIAIIGSIHHVNLVKLHGFCAEGPNRLLVYEHMSRGSLDRSLFAPQAQPLLEWGERHNIALGTARGLAYLHHGCREKIVHCDIKPENILLDEMGETKVSDFGLAKLLSREQSQVFTTLRGTRGYLAPEWLTNSAISDKTDVYSYGMLLLEIVAGRKNCLVAEEEAAPLLTAGEDSSNYFPAYALRLCAERRFSELADPQLEGRFYPQQVEKLVKIALCCVHEDSNLRPSMTKVVHMIEGNVGVEEPQLESLMFLRIYARSFNSPAVTPFVFSKGSNESESESGTTSSTSPYKKASLISAVRLSGPR